MCKQINNYIRFKKKFENKKISLQKKKNCKTDIIVKPIKYALLRSESKTCQKNNA